MASERAVLEKHMEKIVVGFQDRCDDENVVIVLEEGVSRCAGREESLRWILVKLRGGTA